MPMEKPRGLHASFVIGVFFAFASSICMIVSFVSPYWIVAKYGVNTGFQRLGLWEVCFSNFIFPEDYVSKAYDGCWYIYYPEYKYIRFWLNPPWLYGVQMLSIIGLIASLLGLLVILLILCEVYGTKQRRPKITVLSLEAVSLACEGFIVIYMGVMSKDREWMPRSDYNMLSWSFAFAVLSGFWASFCILALVTHYLSVESRIMMEDPIYRQKKFGSQMGYGYQKSVSGFDAPGTESRFGFAPSFFTTAYSTSQLKTGSGLTGQGTHSALTRPSIAPGAVGTAAEGTSAANVSARLRQSLEAQRAAVEAANARLAESRPITTTSSNVIYSLGNISTEAGPVPPQNYPQNTGYRGSVSQLHASVAMDSTV